MSLSGSSGWNAALENQFGRTRWKRLKRAMQQEPLQLAYLPPPIMIPDTMPMHLTTEDLDDSVLRKAGLQHSGLPHCYSSLLDSQHPRKCEATTSSSQLPSNVHYFLDGASCIAALLLGATPGDKVLDLCSAPGGKALIISSRLFGCSSFASCSSKRQSLLVCNEPSPSRLRRLKKNIKDRVPTEAIENGHIVFTQCAENQASLERLGPFDRILVDAPCSTDRHLLMNAAGLASWSLKTVKQNAKRQYELLCRAVRELKGNVGSLVIYSTCALSDMENDEVIVRLLQKSQFRDTIEVIPGKELVRRCQNEVKGLEVEWVCSERAETSDAPAVQSDAEAQTKIFTSSRALSGAIRHPRRDSVSEGLENSPNRAIAADSMCHHPQSDTTRRTASMQSSCRSPSALDSPPRTGDSSIHVFSVRAEETRSGGILFLPDISNLGPLFVCGLKRKR